MIVLTVLLVNMNNRQLVGFVVGFAAVILVLSNLLWFEYVRDLKDDNHDLESARSNEYRNLRNQLQMEKERMKTEIDLIESEKKELQEQKQALEVKLADIRQRVQQFAAENGRVCMYIRSLNCLKDFLKVLEGENSIYDPFVKNPDLVGRDILLKNVNSIGRNTNVIANASIGILFLMLLK